MLDVEYARTREKRLLLDLFLPKRLPKAPLPLIVNVHGGGWSGGSKEWHGDLRQIAQGFAFASINYRFSQEALFPAQIHDCKAAIRFLRANAKEFHIDPQRIGVTGGSAGAHLASLLGTSAGVEELEGSVGGNRGQSSAVQAVCPIAGPTDFLQYFALGGRKTYGMVIGLMDKLLGGPIGGRRALVRLANPIAHITGNEPPFLIVHGDNDTAVPHQQGVILHKALKRAGGDSTLFIVKGGNHLYLGPDVDPAIDAFFAKHLARR
jgi:acetyl esterase/lipase